MFLPWVLFNPVVHTFGVPGFLALALSSAIVPLVYRTISHKLELRADQLALAHEPNSGIYARALAKLYEDGLLPAVNPKKRASHPHLYDRLIAAGLTPEFPRPAAPAAFAWHGLIFSMALGWLSVILIGRMVRF
jgi:Zn-dependent protease with chaperone function